MRRLVPTTILALAASAAGVQAQLGSALVRPVSFPVAPVPFGPGEVLRYEVDWGIFSVGEGRLEVERIDTVRGVPAYHINFIMRGGVPFYSVDDLWQSWLGVEKLISYRFDQKQREGSYKRHRVLDFFPETGRWDRLDHEEEGELPSADPLDDLSFMYFVRTLPLNVGDEYTYNRYWKDEGNPVIIKVLRKERIKVDAGEFETIVVRPIIRTRGMFSEGGEAELFISDNPQRLIVKLTAKMSVGTMRLSLVGYTPGQELMYTPRVGDAR